MSERVNKRSEPRFWADAVPSVISKASAVREADLSKSSATPDLVSGVSDLRGSINDSEVAYIARRDGSQTARCGA